MNLWTFAATFDLNVPSQHHGSGFMRTLKAWCTVGASTAHIVWPSD